MFHWHSWFLLGYSKPFGMQNIAKTRQRIHVQWRHFAYGGWWTQRHNSSAVLLDNHSPLHYFSVHMKTHNKEQNVNFSLSRAVVLLLLLHQKHCVVLTSGNNRGCYDVCSPGLHTVAEQQGNNRKVVSQRWKADHWPGAMDREMYLCLGFSFTPSPSFLFTALKMHYTEIAPPFYGC